MHPGKDDFTCAFGGKSQLKDCLMNGEIGGSTRKAVSYALVANIALFIIGYLISFSIPQLCTF